MKKKFDVHSKIITAGNRNYWGGFSSLFSTKRLFRQWVLGLYVTQHNVGIPGHPFQTNTFSIARQKKENTCGNPSVSALSLIALEFNIGENIYNNCELYLTPGKPSWFLQCIPLICLR